MKCLTTETLERVSLDFLPEGHPAPKHVASCPPCMKRLQELLQEHEALADAIGRLPRRRTASRWMSNCWKPLVIAAAVHLVLLAGALVLFLEFKRSDEPIEFLQASSVQVDLLDPPLAKIAPVRDVFERRGIPHDDPIATPSDEPAIFFGEAKESDHNEEPDREAFFGYVKAEAGGLRGRQAGAPPGFYDSVGAGRGAGGKGGRRARQARAGLDGSEGMTFQDTGVNPVIRTADEAQSTFGLDVDTASYTKVRDFLLRDSLPPKEAVRVEEFLNYFRYADLKPLGETFALGIEAAPSPFDPAKHLLRIALQAKTIHPQLRKNVNFTFVIDVSGSMGMDNRLGLVKRSLELLVDQLRPTDRIGIVTYGTQGLVPLEPTVVARKAQILAIIQGLHTGGSTNLEAGLDLGYDMAAKYFDAEATNRVVICTDGVANNGITDPVVLVRNVKERADKGVWLSVFGFGMDNYNDHMMVTLADKGNGNYQFIDDFHEARKVFTGSSAGLFDVVAADAKIQVEFDPATVESHRLLGYEKRLLRNEDFRNDKIDAGELGAGHHVTALYELTLNPKGEGRVATVRLRYQEPDTKKVVETAKTLRLAQVALSAAEGSASLRLAASVAQFAEILRESPHARNKTLDRVRDQALEAARDLGNPTEAVEFVELVKRAAALR